VKTKALLVAGIIGLTASPGFLCGADSAQPAAEEQLTKIAHDWSESYVKRDASFAQQIIVEDFAFVGHDGNVVNKSDYVKSIPGRPFSPGSTSIISGAGFMVTRRL
jgi:hypothetical protein